MQLIDEFNSVIQNDLRIGEEENSDDDQYENLEFLQDIKEKERIQ